MEKITSTANPRIRNLKKLEKAAERREQNLIVAEGLREVVLASRAGYKIDTLFICEELLKESKEYPLKEICNDTTTAKAVWITQDVYRTVAYRDSTEGIIATLIPKDLVLSNVMLPDNALILVLEGVEKPGNLGAMLRTADAAGVHAVLVCDARCDIYNPNVIRSSVGTVFTNQIAVCNTAEAIAFLHNKKIKSYAAELLTSAYHFNEDYTSSTAFVMGAESTGLSSEWMNVADQRIKIPMHGKIDSMNVSVSAGILLFEAIRQRVQQK
jgi:TrmH family RNA methyltransferase